MPRPATWGALALTAAARESRRHRRFSVDVEAIVHREGGPVKVRTRDVSRSGICLVATTPFPIGEALTIELVLAFSENTFSEPLRIKSRIVWCTAIMRSYQVGVMFDEVAPQQEGFLDMFLHFLDGTLTPKGRAADGGADGADDDEAPPSPDIKDDPFRS
jgi:hypothetical protein